MRVVFVKFFKETIDFIVNIFRRVSAVWFCIHFVILGEEKSPTQGKRPNLEPI